VTHFAPFTPQDRGLAYGDGLFETMRLSGGGVAWWPEHFARMSYTCCALGLPLPDEIDVRTAIDSAVAQSGKTQAVIKLMYTAGSGQRGYLRAEPVEPTLAVLIGDVPAAAPEWSIQGLSVGLLKQSGGIPIPALSGLKHLNRLPQVLARAAWPEGVDECLIHDENGLILGGTQSNFFWLENGRWFTPPTQGSAIAGIVRALLCRYLDVTIAPVSIGRLALAQAAALSNSVRGVLPIGRLAGRVLSLDQSRDMEARWHRLCDIRAEDGGKPVDSTWFALQRQIAVLDGGGRARCRKMFDEMAEYYE
jgi:4-amino-4-deoxychorismate lyase